MAVRSFERTICAAGTLAAPALAATNTRSVSNVSFVAKRRFEDHERCRLLSEDRLRPHQPAAVLVPLFLNHADNKLSVLLTQRSAKLKHHSGEVALPGGRYDEGDESAVATALRESCEEVGLQKHQVEVCTELPPHLVRDMSLVVPVVGFIPENFRPRIHGTEVDAVFRAPLEMFLSSENYTSYYYQLSRAPKKLLIHSFNYVDPEHGDRAFRIWGLAAQVLMTTASIVFNRVPEVKCRLRHYSPTLSNNCSTLLENKETSA